MKYLFVATIILAMLFIGGLFELKIKGISTKVLLPIPLIPLAAFLGWKARLPLFEIVVAMSPIVFALLLDNTKGLLRFFAIIVTFGSLPTLVWWMYTRDQAVLKSGKPTEAWVVDVVETSTTVGVDPVISVQLLVKPPEGPEYDAESTMVISRLGQTLVRPGMKARVKVDPKNPKHVVIESVYEYGR